MILCIDVNVIIFLCLNIGFFVLQNEILAVTGSFRSLTTVRQARYVCVIFDIQIMITPLVSSNSSDNVS